MQTKKTIICLAVSLTALVGVFVSNIFSGINFGIPSLLSKATDRDYSLTIDSSTRFSDNNGEMYTEQGNKITFNSFGLFSYDDGWQTIGNTGYILNETALSGLRSITVTCSDSLKLNYGYSDDLTYTILNQTITSGVPFYFNGEHPTYFKLINDSGVNIDVDSIVITYSCARYNDPRDVDNLDKLSFRLVEDSYYCVSAASMSVSGAIIIPGLYNGLPVTMIDDNGFWYCNNITSITISGAVTSIGVGFNNMNSLQTVNIGRGMSSIFDGAFSICPNLTNINVDSDNATYSSIDGVLFNKDKTSLIRYPEGKVGDYTIPDGVNELYDRETFMNCASLTRLSFPSSLYTIPSNSFQGCTNLISFEVDALSAKYYSYLGVLYDLYSRTLLLCPPKNTAFTSIPGTIEKIGQGAFSNCIYLESITIPANITSIQTDAFTNCASLETVTFESGSKLSLISSDAFNGCTSLESITLPNKVTTVSYGMFNGCTSLSSVAFEGSVTAFETYAFKNCSSLTSITIPNTVKSIGGSCFYRCTSLASVVFEETSTLASIDSDAFYGCTKLESIDLPDSITSIGSAFNNCSLLTSFTFPDDVRYIQYHIFNGCTSLETVVIGANSEQILQEAFYNCSALTSLTIPNSITYIGQDIFDDTDNLTTITYLGTMSEWAAITKDANWNRYSKLTTISCSDGDIAL